MRTRRPRYVTSQVNEKMESVSLNASSDGSQQQVTRGEEEPRRAYLDTCDAQRVATAR